MEQIPKRNKNKVTNKVSECGIQSTTRVVIENSESWTHVLATGIHSQILHTIIHCENGKIINVNMKNGEVNTY